MQKSYVQHNDLVALQAEIDALRADLQDATMVVLLATNAAIGRQRTDAPQPDVPPLPPR